MYTEDELRHPASRIAVLGSWIFRWWTAVDGLATAVSHSNNIFPSVSLSLPPTPFLFPSIDSSISSDPLENPD